MTALKSAVSGYATYRGREGHYTFLLHRITGLGTLLFLTIHILDTATVYFFPNLYAHAIDIYRSTIMGLGEIVLIFCVFYHGMNGLRLAIFDMLAPRGWAFPTGRRSTLVTLAVALVLWAPAAFIMLRNILIHNYGLFGG
jgi:succinate dehydrogenase / fumarate reductase cytochrome b subunit